MIFVDTWGFKAFIDRKEPRHEDVVAVLRENWLKNDFVYTSDYILDETITLISCRCAFDELKRFVKVFNEARQAGYFNLLRVVECDFEAAVDLKLKLADKPRISFTDCTSVVLMKKHGVDKVVTEDKHFGWIDGKIEVLFAQRGERAR